MAGPQTRFQIGTKFNSWKWKMMAFSWMIFSTTATFLRLFFLFVCPVFVSSISFEDRSDPDVDDPYERLTSDHELKMIICQKWEWITRRENLKVKVKRFCMKWSLTFYRNYKIVLAENSSISFNSLKKLSLFSKSMHDNLNFKWHFRPNYL